MTQLCGVDTKRRRFRGGGKVEGGIQNDETLIENKRETETGILVKKTAGRDRGRKSQIWLKEIATEEQREKEREESDSLTQKHRGEKGRK